jgi:phage terminase small subunit
MRGKKPVLPPLTEGEVIDLPSVKGRVPEPPAHLQGIACDIWKEVAGCLVADALEWT